MGGREWLSLRASSGEPWASPLDTDPTGQWGQFSGCYGPLYQPCGGPWYRKAEGEMAHSKVATRWVSFPSRPKKPSWKWIPIVSSPFLPASSLMVLVSWSDCILGALCWILSLESREDEGGSFCKAGGLLQDQGLVLMTGGTLCASHSWCAERLEELCRLMALELGWAAELWSGVGRVHTKADGILKVWSSLLGADPNRYRHSPERLKKGSQDDVSAHVHQGRRQSGKAGTWWAQRLLFRTFNQVGNQPSTAAFGAGSHLSGNPRKGWGGGGKCGVDGYVWSLLPSTRHLWHLPAYPGLDSFPFTRP